MASPALTPENPQRVPVPRFPGPWLDDELGIERESSGEKTGVQAHCLQVAAERLADGHRPREQAAGPQLRHRAGEREWQRALIAHHVDDPGAGTVVRDREQHRR